MARFSKRKQKAYRQQYYSANRGNVSGEMKCYYERTAAVRKEAEKEVNASNPEPKRRVVKFRYDSNPEPRKKAMKSWYASKDESHKRSMKSRYTSNLEQGVHTRN